MPKSCPPEFRRKVLDLLDAGRKVADVAADLGVTQASIYIWRRQHLIDTGRMPGLTSSDHVELVAARKRIAELSLDAEIDGVLSRLEGSTGLRLVGPCMKKRRGDGEEHAQGNVDPEVSVVAHCQLDDFGTQEGEAPDNRSCWPVRDAPGDDRCDDEEQAGRTNGASDDLVSVQLGVVATAQEQSDEHRLGEQQHHVNRDSRSEEQRSELHD